MVSIRRRTRAAAALGGLTAAAVALGTMLAPAALANPISSTHDFSDGTQGWFSYGGGSSSEVVGGEYCVTVPGGTANPWDVAIQHDDVEFAQGSTYTVKFKAHATRDVTVNLRAGIGWPDDVSSSVTAGPQSDDYAFTWTPAFSGNGNLSFQLGGQAEDYTLCIDDFVVEGETSLLATSFDGVLPAGWSIAGWEVTSEAGAGEPLCVVVPGTEDNPYQGLVFNGLPIEQGGNYVLKYTASASNGATIRTIIGENGGSYRTAFTDQTALSAELTEHVLPFTSSFTFPAEPGDAGTPVGQVALQMSQRGNFTFCITSLSLTKVATPPPPYEPDTRGPVRVNQLGYLPGGPKNATVVSDSQAPLAWQLKNQAGAVVASGNATPAGLDPTSQLTVQTIDFSAYGAEGDGFTLVVGDDVSDPFSIKGDLYQQLRYDALNYFYPVRSGVAVDVPNDAYDRPAGHVSGPDGAVNKGDLDVACLTAAQDGSFWSYGGWTCPAGYNLDVVGGWYDAGDHGKYVVNGGIAVAQLMQTYERSLYAKGAAAGKLGDGSMIVPADETHNGIPDVLDEAKWELDFFLAMQVPQGSGMTVSATDTRSLDGLVHHKIHDLGWTGLGLLPSADAQQRRLHRPSTAATLNMAATAAQGARLFKQYDPAYSATLLAAAKSAYLAAKRVPDLYAPASAGANGGGPYNDDNVSDEFYWAAAELFLTTGQKSYQNDVLASPDHTADIWGPSGIAWQAVAGLGRLDLATVPSKLPNLAAVKASVVAGADKYLAWQQAESFGTTYPGTPAGDYEWGSNSMVVNNQIVLGTAFDLTGQRKYADSVLEAMDYLLGRNGMNNSYITGYGTQFSSHQHSRWLVPPQDGTLSGGPNSQRGTWDPVMNSLYPTGHDCAPQLCYVDSIEAWSVNELTVNWNAPMSWVASFVADLGDGRPAVAPAITKQPASAKVALGANATFTAAASGTPAPTVQWQSRRGSASWANVAGATSTTLVVKATAALDGQQYRAVFTNKAGAATSNAATLTVKATAPVFTKQPVSVTAKKNTVAKFTATATGYPEPTVLWLVRPKGLPLWLPVATGNSIDVLALKALDGLQVQALAVNTAGATTSSKATLTVK